MGDTNLFSYAPSLASNEAIISLGSNWGNRKQYLKLATDAIATFAKITSKTGSNTTVPFGYNDQPPFLNQLIKIQTILKPEELLKKLQTIELELHRKRTIKMGPRTIDLDIIFFGKQKINTKTLKIPHHAITSRPYLQNLLMELNDQ